MKHTTSRLLFGYWDEIRGDRDAPERRDVEPGRIRHLLADTFILGAEPGGSPTFRLAGTRCSALFGRDLTDVAFRNLWPEGYRHEADELVGIVQSDRCGVVAGLRGEAETGAGLALELVMLPLRHHGSNQRRLIGALSPTSLPVWNGDAPVSRLRTRSSRVIQTKSGIVAGGARRAGVERSRAAHAVRGAGRRPERLNTRRRVRRNTTNPRAVHPYLHRLSRC